MAGAARIDDREAAMAEGNAPASRIYRIRGLDTFVVSTAMLQAMHHGPHWLFRIVGDYSRDAAHFD